jgi:hypothetical protein
MSYADSIRAELRSIRQQESGAWLPEHELRALSRRATVLIKKAGLWGVAPGAYERWLEGASLEAARSQMRVAWAKPAAAPSPPSPASSRDAAATRPAAPSPQIGKATMTETASHAAPRPSRATEVAEVYLSSINASRKRCGTPPLTLAELTHEFAHLDRTPAPSSGMTRPARGNAIAARQDAPTTQAAIDDMWSGFAAKLNATLPARREPIGTRASSAPGGGSTAQAVDWSSIVAGLNAEALKTPVRPS